MQRKKSKFWLFILSLIPGVGEMYLGFMKMGVSLMLGFAGLIAFAAFTDLGVLAIFPVVLWFYSFFHANNLGGLSDEEFARMEDRYLFGLGGIEGMEQFQTVLLQKYRKIAAAALIIIGVVMLGDLGFGILLDIFGYDNKYMKILNYYVYDVFPRAVFAVAVIWIGIVLIRGKKADLPETESGAFENGRQDDTDQPQGVEEGREGKGR